MFFTKNKNGADVCLLTPAEKGKKYAEELKLGYKLTNDGKIKLSTFGSKQALTKEERAYRSGYLDSRKDCAAVWRASNNNSVSQPSNYNRYKKNYNNKQPGKYELENQAKDIMDGMDKL